MAKKWLDDDEQAAWRSYLMTSQLLFEALDRQMQRDAGMPHTYYILLAMLSEQPDRALTMSQLARIVGYSPSRLSHAVARLEEQGWVRRTRHPEDRRTTILELTDEGMEVVKATAPGHVAEVRRILFDALTPDQVAAFRSINDAALARLLEEADCDGTPSSVRGVGGPLS
jgi:DNA-binding MarR family transcriptional regulator